MGLFHLYLFIRIFFSGKIKWGWLYIHIIHKEFLHFCRGKLFLKKWIFILHVSIYCLNWLYHKCMCAVVLPTKRIRIFFVRMCVRCKWIKELLLKGLWRFRVHFLNWTELNHFFIEPHLVLQASENYFLFELVFKLSHS